MSNLDFAFVVFAAFRQCHKPKFGCHGIVTTIVAATRLLTIPAITCVPKRLRLVAQMLRKPHCELNQMERIRELGIRLGSIALGVQPVSV